MRRVLRHRDFRLLFLGQAASTVGDRIVFIALALYVSDIGEPSDVGIVLAAHALPLVAFLLVGGVWADRLPRHRVMIATDLIRAALHATLAVLIFLGPVAIWQIVLIELAFGSAEAFFRPAYTGLVPQTVPASLLQQANGFMSIARYSATIAGAAVGGALVATIGSGWAILLDGTTYATSAVLLGAMALPAAARTAAATNFLDELREGWHAFTEHTWMWLMTAWI
ncbi:MAG: MFS transporter, partial [Actinomycetota bacterium]|nr:MFS transporter [Actinomycetota bacterium]